MQISYLTQASADAASIRSRFVLLLLSSKTLWVSLGSKWEVRAFSAKISSFQDSFSTRTPYFGTPISYPNSTSVVLPSHPLFPAAEIKYLHVGSR